MVKNYEDESHQKNVYLFTVEYDHYCGQRKDNYVENWHPDVRGVLQNNFSFTGRPEKLQKNTLFF